MKRIAPLIFVFLLPSVVHAEVMVKKICDIAFENVKTGELLSASPNGAVVNDIDNMFTIYAKSGKYSYSKVSPVLTQKSGVDGFPEHGEYTEDGELMRRLDDGSEFYVTTKKFRIVAINCK